MLGDLSDDRAVEFDPTRPSYVDVGPAYLEEDKWTALPTSRDENMWTTVTQRTKAASDSEEEDGMI